MHTLLEEKPNLLKQLVKVRCLPSPPTNNPIFFIKLLKNYSVSNTVAILHTELLKANIKST